MKRLSSLGVALILALTIAPVAVAKKPAPSSATLAVSPSVVQPYEVFTISGCGYGAGASVTFIEHAPGGLAFWGAFAGADGCLTAAGWAPGALGSAIIDARDSSGNVLASAAFSIAP